MTKFATGWVLFGTGRIHISHPLPVIVGESTPIGTIVHWIGNSDMEDILDKPCEYGICHGTFHDWQDGQVWIYWVERCAKHERRAILERVNSELVGIR